jgi:hypothetical protein
VAEYRALGLDSLAVSDRFRLFNFTRLTGLAQQIHDRVLAAKDLVIGMNDDTRSRRMSSGTAHRHPMGPVRQDERQAARGVPAARTRRARPRPPPAWPAPRTMKIM